MLSMDAVSKPSSRAAREIISPARRSSGAEEIRVDSIFAARARASFAEMLSSARESAILFPRLRAVGMTRGREEAAESLREVRRERSGSLKDLE